MGYQDVYIKKQEKRDKFHQYNDYLSSYNYSIDELKKKTDIDHPDY